MPEKLDLGDLDARLAGHALRRLGDPELPEPTLLAAAVEEAVPISDGTVEATVGGEVGIDVFNAAGDEDPAGVFGEASAPDATPRELELRTPVPFVADSAWLAYRSRARVGAKGGVRASKFGFAASAEGDVSVALHDYRRHAAEDFVGPAVAADLAAARFAVSVADVRSLAPGEALAFEVNGTLGASVSLRWSDTLTSHIGVLGALLAPGEDFGVKVAASLQARFKVDIQDHFLVVFSRRRQGQIDVQVRKSDRDTLALGAAARISVRFADRGRMEEMLETVMEGLLGEPLAQVRALLAVPRVSDLGPVRRALAERLVDRLRLEGRRLRLDALRKRIEALESDAKAALGRIARQQARFALEFEYRRKRADEALIEVTVDEERLGSGFGALHRAVLVGDLDRVAEAGARAASGVTLHRFLQRDTVKTTKTRGVSLDLGSILSMGGKARTYLRETMRRDHRDDRSRFSFTAIEGYAGKWGRDTCEWKTTLTARSRRWTEGARPPADSLRYALHLSMRYGERELSARDAGRLVDLGVLWGSVTPGGASATRARLGRLGRERRDVRVSSHLRFGQATFPILLPLLAAEDLGSVGVALARAVPWLDGEAGRETPLVRQFLYRDLWRQYLEDSSISDADLAAAAAAAARQAGHAGLAGFERRMRHWWTAGDLARRNGDTRARWADLARGAARLHEAISGGGPHTEVGEAARLLRRGWEHAFHVRALGAYLTEAFRAHPRLWGSVSRSLRVEYGEQGERVVLNLSST